MDDSNASLPTKARSDAELAGVIGTLEYNARHGAAYPSELVILDLLRELQQRRVATEPATDVAAVAAELRELGRLFPAQVLLDLAERLSPTKEKT